MSQGLDGVRKAAKERKQERFTALLHHLNVDLLRDGFYALQRKASPGVDGVTWQEYETGLEDRLVDLHSRVHRGAYRAKPSRRVFIPKADGRQRPLGVAALEDKIVQQAAVTILNQIYEVDFKGFSYGFRPGRSPHQALDALTVGIQRRRVNWVLDADIRGFFDNLSHEWTMKFIEHRVADRRILRLIRKWLKAGVSEDGQWSETKLGTPQGAVASPLLANVYLHYLFDLWADVWRRKVAKGDVIVVRYADDLVVGFQHRTEAERFLKEFRERLAKFGLELHPDKTRLIEFGRFAARDRKARGEGKPETFTFLGFTHYCGSHGRSRCVAPEGRAGLLPIPRCSREHDSVAHLQTSRVPAMAECSGPPQSARTDALGTFYPSPEPVDSSTPRSAPLSRCALLRHSSFVRAVCVDALVRICAGGDQ
jgi:group II intron reverse transcriptase/maturase